MPLRTQPRSRPSRSCRRDELRAIHVRRHTVAGKPLGLGRDELALGARWRRTPQVGERVLVVAVDPQHQELAPHKKGGRSMAQLLGHPRQIQADGADAFFQARPGRHVGTPGDLRRRSRRWRAARPPGRPVPGRVAYAGAVIGGERRGRVATKTVERSSAPVRRLRGMTSPKGQWLL
jgi:hypothetical protein